MTRQRFRKLILIVSLLFFPITLYYFSPALIINSGFEGIINGSFIIFVAMFIVSVFFGRLFCAYLCPGGGLQECAFLVSDKIPKQGLKNYIKYVIWFIWIAIVIFSYIYKGKIIKVDFFYGTEHGISMIDIQSYIIYYIIVLLMLLPALIGGKRTFCHYFCWMAPFMVIGTKLRKLLHLPGLYVSAKYNECVSCKKCNNVCPMCINVEKAVKDGSIDSPECIQCGACVDSCPKKVLKYSMRRRG
ncbi:MAG: 4Fe-4S binding protein [Oscillospiraceae bacterium]|nr:4Fe-4S binding protein [Oscillospiraceae bacterium]